MVAATPKDNPRNASADFGPWSPAALARRAQADLLAIAEDIRGRQVDPFDVLLALGCQAALWTARGAALPAGAPIATLRRLTGLAHYDVLGAWRERIRRADQAALVSGIDPGGTHEQREWRRRAMTLSDWLRRHAGTAEGEEAVRVHERYLCQQLLEGAK